MIHFKSSMITYGPFVTYGRVARLVAEFFRSRNLYRIRCMGQQTSLDPGQRMDGQFQNSYPDEHQDRTAMNSLQFGFENHSNLSANQMTVFFDSYSKPAFNILLPVTIIRPRIIITKWIRKRNEIINHMTSSFVGNNINKVYACCNCKPVRCITTTIDFLYFKQNF